MDSEKCGKIFFISFGIFRKLGNKETSRKRTLVGTRHQGAPGSLARPDGFCPPGTPSGVRFSTVCLSSKIKKIYIYFPNLLTTVSRRNPLFSFLAVFWQIQLDQHHVFLTLQQWRRRHKRGSGGSKERWTWRGYNGGRGGKSFWGSLSGLRERHTSWCRGFVTTDVLVERT